MKRISSDKIKIILLNGLEWIMKINENTIRIIISFSLSKFFRILSIEKENTFYVFRVSNELKILKN
jgi:hypothetical protein